MTHTETPTGIFCDTCGCRLERAYNIIRPYPMGCGEDER